MRKGVTRREFMKAGVASVGGAALVGPARAQDEKVALGPGKVPCELTVNGRKFSLEVEPRVTLMRALRHHLDFTGPKEACDRGACGACTVLVDGLPVASCMMLALDARGKEIVTVEGLARDGRLHPVQRAFAECDAFQCGYCTPGMVVAAKALLDRNSNPTLDEIKAGLAGNLCRCGAYNHIFEAVQKAAKVIREGK
jgi:xanthine dehydrogenase YagT iron-sulfur-binding subunit